MKIIKAYADIIDDIEGEKILKKIETVGRTCYKSEDKIEEGSAEKFVASLIKREHEAMLEHATFIFEINVYAYSLLKREITVFEEKECFKSYLRFTKEKRFVVSGNVRAWRDFLKIYYHYYGEVPFFMRKFVSENPILFPEFQNFPEIDVFDGCVNTFKQIYTNELVTLNEKYTHHDITVKFVTDRGITHEIVRHRPVSFAQESTRYCNYSKDKFNNELTFIKPDFFEYGSEGFELWKAQMEDAEMSYFALIDVGCTAEKARTVLPTSIKTELIMTANLKEWRHFFKLRACNTTGVAHPQMLEITRPLLDKFKELIAVIFDDINY